MNCVACGNDNVTIEMMQAGGRTRTHGTGLGGKTNNMARGMTAVSTLGMSNLVWKKSKGTEKMKYKNQKVALCQTCGHDWSIR
ncbi:hypothetical protein CLV47_11363 [Antricoccus suffuscus]|uniref:Uncharacterized protein n=1 Tax=Antricoccus suffuscus TaxID=1629062 RepID=A0A2T0ZXU4_9ACTN|nr:hypothetical protein [Antricoccus suffuscus]PRZ40898.1 hypothetical protein CLV47_11363 [Antricoccus suffuscus]